MDQRLTFITLGVRDLSVMRSFYVDTFGWQPMQEEQSIVFFRLNGIVLALYPAEELADDIGVPAGGASFKSYSLSINFSSEAEVDAAYCGSFEQGCQRRAGAGKGFLGRL